MSTAYKTQQEKQLIQRVNELLPPANETAEKTLLAYMMGSVSENPIADQIEGLPIDIFTSELHQKCFQAIKTAYLIESTKEFGFITSYSASKTSEEDGEGIRLYLEGIESDMELKMGKSHRAVLEELKDYRKRRAVLSECILRANNITNLSTNIDTEIEQTSESLQSILNSSNPLAFLQYELSDDTPIEDAIPLLYRYEQPTIFNQDSTLITGLAKTKKTFLSSAIAAAAIGGEPEDCLGFSLPDGARPMKVLFFDTEQLHRDGQRVRQRIFKMAGESARKEQLIYSCLKQCSIKDNYDIVRSSIVYHRPQLTIIDGLTDLVYNVNDPEESSNMVRDIGKLCDKYNTAILCIIHINQGKDNDSNKARGHIGSEAERKFNTKICLSLIGKDDNKVTKVAFQLTRYAPIDGFCFRINEDGLPEECEDDEEMEEYSSNNTMEIRISTLISLLDTNTKYRRIDLTNKLTEALGVKKRTADTIVTRAKEDGRIIQDDTYYYLPKYGEMLSDDDLPL